MKLKWLLLLLLPVTVFGQAYKKKGRRPGPTSPAVVVPAQLYTFHFLIMDDFITTSPENGGKAIYKYDTLGHNLDGEIDVNPAKKRITITYDADKKDPMIAILDGKVKYDAATGTYSYKAHWSDSDEKTEITTTYNNDNKTVKVWFGPHKGDYASYWDRIYKFSVAKKE